MSTDATGHLMNVPVACGTLVGKPLERAVYFLERFTPLPRIGRFNPEKRVFLRKLPCNHFPGARRFPR